MLRSVVRRKDRGPTCETEVLFYKTVIRPEFLYGAAPCAAMKRQEKRIEVGLSEIMMLWWIGCTEWHANTRS